MLKRQRPTTPPTSLASVPPPSEFAETDPDSLYPHARKRRRVAAPVLDGRERGIQLDDELMDEAEEEEIDTSDTTTSTDILTHWAQQTAQYKQSNALLHQLHLEHQHRAQIALLHTLEHHHRNNNGAASSPGQLGKFQSPARLPGELTASAPIDDSRNVNADEELVQVRARYEQHNRCESYLYRWQQNSYPRNRLLGSLVRRRKEEHSLRRE